MTHGYKNVNITHRGGLCCGKLDGVIKGQSLAQAKENDSLRKQPVESSPVLSRLEINTSREPDTNIRLKHPYKLGLPDFICLEFHVF